MSAQPAPLQPESSQPEPPQPVPPQSVSLLTPRIFFPFVLIVLIWGSTWIVIKGQLGDVPTSWSVAYRFAIASAAMFAYAAVRGERLFPGWKAVGFAGLVGLGQFVFNFNFVYRAEAYLTSGLVAVLFALLMVPNSIMGRIFLKMRLERRFLIGASVAIVGVGLMLAQEYRAAELGPQAVLLGTALTMAGMMSASTANVMQGMEFARKQSMVMMIAWAAGLGALANAAFAWATAGAPVIDMDAAYIGGLFYLGVVGSAISFPIYFNIIREVGPSQASWTSVMIPMIAMIISTVVEGYHWANLSIMGAVLALAGLVIAVARKS